MTSKEKKALRAKIFHYFAGEHSLTLLDSELEEIVGFFAEEDPGGAETDDLEQLIKTFRHPHVNNGYDDSCDDCGLDLRNKIHSRLREPSE